jgi:FRG domain
MQIRAIPALRLLDWVHEFDSVPAPSRKWAWIQREEQLAFAPLWRTNYLYRGQARHYTPCRASICRDVRSGSETLAEIDRNDALTVLRRLVVARWFCSELNNHPFFQLATERQWYVDPLAIAQHYGVPTGYLDLTGALDVAVFFATCTFDGAKWTPATDGEGILYRLDWDLAQVKAKGRGEEIDLSPFSRPHMQWAWTFTLALADFETMPGLSAVVFEHHRAVGEAMLRRFDGGVRIFPPDPLAGIAIRACSSQRVPRKFVSSVAEDAAAQLAEPAESIMRAMVVRNQFEATDDTLSLWSGEIADDVSVWREEIARFEADVARNTILFLVKKEPEREEAG